MLRLKSVFEIVGKKQIMANKTQLEAS